jgi:ribonuclease D
LLEYAVNDVLNLFTIEREITTELQAKNLYDAYRDESARLTEKNFIIDHMTHYRAKFPDFKKLTPPQKHSAAVVWVFRELMGKHFDCSVGYILSKSAMVHCIQDPERMALALEQELNRGRSKEKWVSKSLVDKYYQEALRITGE